MASKSDREHNLRLDELEVSLDELEDLVTAVHNEMHNLVILESDMMSEAEIDYRNRLYAG